jgi:hypothetical protein
MLSGDGFDAPEFLHSPPRNQSVAKPHQLVKHRQWGRFSKPRQGGHRRRYIDRRAGEHQLAHLGREARRVDQRHPAALAQADQIGHAADLVDDDVELGEIIVDAEKTHFGGRRAPIGHEYPLQPGLTQRGNKAVAGGEIGHRRARRPADAVPALS